MEYGFCGGGGTFSNGPVLPRKPLMVRAEAEELVGMACSVTAMGIET